MQAAIAPVAAGERTTRIGPGVNRATSLHNAGWSRSERVPLAAEDFDSLSWGNLRTLWAARREIRLWSFNAPDAAAAAMRGAWVANLPAPATIRLQAEDPGATRVLVLGDTGDGSEAQRAVARQMHARVVERDGKARVSALLIQSDVVYPAGAADEYGPKFFRAYRSYHRDGVPIYAVPGNHDWDDGTLAGFMATFCDRETTPDDVYRARDTALTPLQRLWWRPRSARPHRRWVTSGATAEPALKQRRPYLALDIGGVIYIGIDTGFGSSIDRAQARWLVDVAESPGNAHKPKILFTGKPLIVNGSRRPCPIHRDPETGEEAITGAHGCYRFVDDVVRNPANGFVAVLGGDVHNYQRYRARIRSSAGTRDLPYVVSGGGGVFVGQTYWLPRIAVREEVEGDTIEYREEETVLFPTRAHSYLYWDRLARQARGSAPFSTSVTMALSAILSALVAGVIALAEWTTPLSISSPTVRASMLLALTAAAANMGARPIAGRARGVSLALATGAGAIILWWVGSDRSLDLGCFGVGNDLGRWLVAAGFTVGAALLQAAELRLFSRGWKRRVRSVLATLATLLLAAATAWLLATSFGHRSSAGWHELAAAIIAGSALGLFCWATRLAMPHPDVDETFEAFDAELTSGANTKLTRALRRARAVGERQKLFSIFETFNDGRLTHLVASLFSGGQRQYLPLYRSFLEVESRREDGVWRVQITSYAVTGELISDEPDVVDEAFGPVVVDRFTAVWAPGRPVSTEVE